jgi:uroporphyrinogen decarboxylase
MNDLFLRACRGEPVERTPVWLIRQAGRSLPDYRSVRERVDFVTLCRTPELAARVSLEPLDRLGVDAVIFFSDILVPAEALGLEVAFRPGPVVDRPVRSAGDVARLAETDPEESVPFVYETLRLLRRALDGRAPLIGFAGAPFTLAAYLVEGRGTRGFPRMRSLLVAEPAMAHRLLELVARVTERYLAAQVRAGAQAVQLFDTWAGLLAPDAYREFALRYARQVLEGLRGSGVPRIYFAVDAAHLLEAIGEAGADVLGVDWRVDLDEAARRIGGKPILQGNLDPAALLAPPPAIVRSAERVLARARGLGGHVFNLGHGVLPGTPLEHLETLVRTVHARSARSGS